MPRFLVLSAILLATFAMTACTGDSELTGSAVDSETASKSTIGDAGDSSASTDTEGLAASAMAIFDAIARIEGDTIDMKGLSEVATQQGLNAEMKEFSLHVQRISNGDLGSGRSGGDAAFAEGLMSGKSVSIQDLRDFLQAIGRG